jgi:flavin-dependent dehydrogenase
VPRQIKLQDGDRIAVIGSGPAGTFFSFLASRLARARGLKVSITIFDGKDFVQTGPPGCNMCAGVISETLSEKLHKIGLDMPADRVQVEIENYLFSTEYYNLSLFKRRHRFPIYTVYRGNGPRDRIGTSNVSFDDFLLERCKAEGIEVIREMVKELVLPDDPSKPVEVHYGREGKTFEAALLVVACGLNTKFLDYLSGLGFGYKPPHMVHTVQAEIRMPEGFTEDRLKHSITSFALERGNIRFAAFTPKKRHLTLTIIGKKDAQLRDVQTVLSRPRVKHDFLHEAEPVKEFCFCRPKIALSPAHGVFSDRLVVIGDAAFSRYYKSGIESAFDTANSAAQCVIEHGVSAADFRRYYLNRDIRLIRNSSYYGQALFFCYDIIFHNRLLSAALISLLYRRPGSFSSRQMTRVLWSMFTGNRPYRTILLQLFHPRVQGRMALEIARVTARKFFLGKGALDRGNSVRQEVDSLGPLGSGQTVAIIGGGPGGVGCAIALKKFSRERGLDLKVVIYEGKEFETAPHYNQCVGVLSPPIVDILENELGVPFPYHLAHREITGYVLHSDNRSLALPGEGETSVSVRRVNFDNYLLNQAKSLGVEVVKSRVTDLEFRHDAVMVYSETDSRPVDVVVGAFGLDDGTAKVFERCTKYRQPRFLNSIVTKIHPGAEVVQRFENNIHAFLPSEPEIEFGAVTPKKDHLTINVAGAEVTAQSLQNFLNMDEVRKVLPPTTTWNPETVSYFKGKFPIHVAKGFYGDRYVLIGDAAGLLRPFKGKGVNSAILTGMRAAKTMLDNGIGRQAFKVFHGKCHDITGDLLYGKVMRWAAMRIANWGILDPILDVAQDNPKLKRALFDSISAHRSYKIITRNFWDFKLFAKMGKAIFLHMLSGLRTRQPQDTESRQVRRPDGT